MALRGRPRKDPLANYGGAVAVGREREEDLIRDTRGIYISDDGRRQIQESTQAPRKKQRVTPSTLADPLANWIPGAVDHDTANNCNTENTHEHIEPEVVNVTFTTEREKRKRYLSSVSTWVVSFRFHDLIWLLRTNQ